MLLIDLPQELLLHIGKCLGNTSLSRLSTTCRHFHYQLFTEVLKRLNVADLEESNGLILISYAHSGNGYRRLPLKQLGLGVYKVKSYKHIQCRFTQAPGAQNALRSMLGFLAQMKDVDSVKIKVEPSYNQTVDGLGKKERDDWIKWLAAVTTMCTEKGAALEVVGSLHSIAWEERAFKLTYVAQPTEEPSALDGRDAGMTRPKHSAESPQDGNTSIIYRSVKALCNTFQCLSNGTSTSKHHPPQPDIIYFPNRTASSGLSKLSIVEKDNGLHIPTGVNPQIKTFILDSPLFFSLSLFRWTLSVLNSAPITRLSLGSIGLSVHESAKLLSSITIPTLQTLNINNRCISYSSLSEFLLRHQGITSFEMSTTSCFTGSSSSIGAAVSRGILSNLKHFKGSIEMAFSLLRGESAVPLLTSINIHSPHDSTLVFQQTYEDIIRALGSHHRKNDISLCIHLPRYRTIDWMSCIRQESDIPDIHSAVTCVKSLEFIPGDDEDSYLDPRNRVVLLQWASLFPCIESLAIGIGNPKFEMWQPHDLAVLRQKCPNLKRIEVGEAAV